MKQPKIKSKSKQKNKQNKSISPLLLPSFKSESQQECMFMALETLDYQHSLMLLNSCLSLSPKLICYRAKASLWVSSEPQCLKYIKQCLLSEPNCENCVKVLLSLLKRNKIKDQYFICKMIKQLLKTPKNSHIDIVRQLAQYQNNAGLYTSMIKDLVENGAEFNQIKIINNQNSQRTVIACKYIPKNQIIMIIPKQQLITLQRARQQSQLVKALIQHKVNLLSPKHTFLCIYLLEQQQLKQNSKFYNYIKTLPNKFDNFPVNYSLQLLDQLKGTHFYTSLQTKKYDLLKDYQSITTHDPTFAHKFNLRKFIQARMIVCSRVFGIIIQNYKTDALVPIADMLNHCTTKQTTWFYCNKKQGFVVSSFKQIAAGSEILDSYGPKCNSRYLLSYGFTLQNNPYNQVIIEIKVDWTEQYRNSCKIKINKNLHGKGFGDMMGMIRSACYKPKNKQSQSQEEIEMGIQGWKHTQFMNNENELSAWKYLQKIIKNQLLCYPRTMQQQAIRLKNSQDQNLKNIITLRMGEKDVLLFYQKMCQKMITYFTKGGSHRQFRQYDSYLETIPQRPI